MPFPPPASTFPLDPPSLPVSLLKAPREITIFSYDEAHQYHPDDRSLRYYYTPSLPAMLSEGFETFQKHDDSVDEHLDGLLKAIMELEERTGEMVRVDVVTWRGMMTKVMAAPFDRRDGYVSWDVVVGRVWLANEGYGS